MRRCATSCIHVRQADGRSEERRVGEEGRSRGAPHHLKKKKNEVGVSVDLEECVERAKQGSLGTNLLDDSDTLSDDGIAEYEGILYYFSCRGQGGVRAMR